MHVVLRGTKYLSWFAVNCRWTAVKQLMMMMVMSSVTLTGPGTRSALLFQKQLSGTTVRLLSGLSPLIPGGSMTRAFDLSPLPSWVT